MDILPTAMASKERYEMQIYFGRDNILSADGAAHMVDRWPTFKKVSKLCSILSI